MDNGIDDKCPACGEWTRRAFDYYGGRYNNGGDMDYCQCDAIEDPDEYAWEPRVVSATDRLPIQDLGERAA